MGWRFRRTNKLGPFQMTTTGNGVSFSVGVPGARYTWRADGKKQVTVGLPGTGIYYTETLDRKKKKGAKI